jgi:hypothetical protein
MIAALRMRPIVCPDETNIIVSSYIPTSINVSYTDAADCVSDTNNEPCAYTYEVCAETVASLGDLVVQSTLINLNFNSLTPGDYKQITNTITSSSTSFQISDCYNLTTYDENVDFITPYTISDTSDCNQAGKCDVINVLLTNCDNSETSIINMSYVFATGNTISSGDTISIASWSPYIGNATTNTCYVVGGKTNTITSSQSSGVIGTYWEESAYNSSVQTNCADEDCGCRSKFAIYDESGGGVSNVYYKGCDGTLYGPFTINPGSSLTIPDTDCINVNSIWLYASIYNYINDISVSGAYINCT